MSDATKGYLFGLGVFLGVALWIGCDIKSFLIVGIFFVIGYCIIVLPMQIQEDNSQGYLSATPQSQEHHYHYYQAPRGYAATETRFQHKNGSAVIVRRLERYD